MGADLPDWMKEEPTKESTQAEKPKKEYKKAADEPETSVRRPKLINPAELEEKDTDWLWSNKIPLGELTLLSGMPGQGKTFWSCYLSAIITNGWDWADGTPCRKGAVLFFLGEDSIEKTYKPRLRANGADQEKIRFLAGVELLEPGKEPGEAAFSMKNLGDIEEAIRMTEQQTGVPVLLVVVDPIANHWGGVKENDNIEVREVLSPLNRLAERMQTAFLLIQHTGKGDKVHAQHRILGSTGIVGQCRNVWGLYPSAEKDHRIFAPIKANLCVEPTAVDFVISPTEAGGRVEIVNAALGVTGDDMEAIYSESRQNGRGRKPDRTGEAEEWLSEFLKDGRKPAGKEDDPAPGSVRYESEKAGLSWRTIRRAANLLGVVIRREIGVSFWSLPASETMENPPVEPPTDSEENQLGQNSAPYTPCNFGQVASPENEKTYESTCPTWPEFGNFGQVDEKPQTGPKRHRASELEKGAAS